MLYRTLFFLAFLATALALGGALAHAYELPNKLRLSREAYFTVQQIYTGWSLFAFVLLAEVLSIGALAYLARRETGVVVPLLLSLLFIVGAQAVFWMGTFPANAATQNWRIIPDDWETLRARWEWSHLAGAGFHLAAFAALSWAALARAAPPA